MSMLTPTGTDRRRRPLWRSVRTAVTLVIAVLLVVGAVWYSWTELLGVPDDTAATGAESCAAPAAVAPVTPAPPTGPAPVPEPLARPAEADGVGVNVYNATTRAGLAAAVAAEMAQRGFQVYSPANDPLERDVTAPAEVRSGPDGLGGARVVWAQVAGATYLQDDRTGGTVDLVLGAGYDGLRSPEEAAAAAIAPPAEPTPAPTPEASAADC